MCWEIHASTFRDGEAFEFDTADLRALFERGTMPQPAWPPQNTDFLYEDGHVRLDIADCGPRRDGFVVHRIFGQTAVAPPISLGPLVFSSPMTKQDWIEAQAEYAQWHEQHERNFRLK